MKKNILVFGLIAGVVVSVLMAVTMILSKHNPSNFDYGLLVGYASMLLAFSMIFVAVKNYRDKFSEGVISFKNAFLIGMGITLIASVLYVATWVFIYKNIYPEFLVDYKNYQIESMHKDGKGEAEIKEATVEMEEMFVVYDSWIGLIGFTFIEIFPIGLIVSVIAAFVLKRKQVKVSVV